MLETLSGLVAVLFWLPFSLAGLAVQFFSSQPLTSWQPGIVYSFKQAESLGLEPKQTYLDILNGLQPHYLRIIAYWDRVEKYPGVYDFSEIDFQIQEAQQRNIATTIVMGKKVPRWPECHLPLWFEKLGDEQKQQALLDYLKVLVLRYKDSPALEYWQVENEPFYEFGSCPKLNSSDLQKEITLVKAVDPQHPIVLTASGEMDTWLRPFIYGDLVGVSLYHRFFVAMPFFKVGLNYPLPPLFYKEKAAFFKIFFKKDIMVTELQLEAWLDKGFTAVPLTEQFKELSFERFKSYLAYARQVRIERQYLWGVEWWYWLKAQGHPEFWDYVKSNVFSN